MADQFPYKIIFDFEQLGILFGLEAPEPDLAPIRLQVLCMFFKKTLQLLTYRTKLTLDKEVGVGD